MPYENGGNGNRPRKKRLKKLFLRTFLITFASLATLVFAGWLTLQSVIKPPEIPDHSPPAAKTEQHEAAYVVPEAEQEDTLIGGGLHAPEGFTRSDRKNDFYTFLIFGLDEGNNTDSIMVAAYDDANKKAYVIGLPRDLKVNVKRRVKKINAAYPAGTLNGGGRIGGAEQLKREIKTIIGFTPDYFICVNLEAFERVIDAVGGVEVNVPYEMNYTDTAQDLTIQFDEGIRTLNGKEALAFARHRRNNEKRGGEWVTTKSYTDYERIENQQAVIRALISKLLTPASILKLDEFIDIFNENVYTDIALNNMGWFAYKLNDIRSADEALETYTIPTTGTTGAPDWYELPDETAIVELINSTINPYVKNIEAKDLEIAN
ncbi:MAG: LCP family protein [Clostridiales bacterium]|jgi:LCP family protein required for cell wall assembly|nr:LCP family protein [Clostridiales bacterium]